MSKAVNDLNIFAITNLVYWHWKNDILNIKNIIFLHAYSY